MLVNSLSNLQDYTILLPYSHELVCLIFNYFSVLEVSKNLIAFFDSFDEVPKDRFILKLRLSALGKGGLCMDARRQESTMHSASQEKIVMYDARQNYEHDARNQKAPMHDALIFKMGLHGILACLLRHLRTA